MQESPLEVAVSLRSGLAYTMEILHGIADYSRQQGHWTLEVDSDLHFGQRPARLDRHWRGDGVILLGGESQVFDSSYFRQHCIPVVNATGWHDRYPGVPEVFWDDEEIAATAAAHLAGLGLERFAYFGPRVFPPSHERALAFQRQIQARGSSCILCEWTVGEIGEVAIWGEKAWWQAAEFFKQRLARLETPVGILANNDITASVLMNSGQEIGLTCPRDLAVVGFWNDRVICESTDPPLSSIETDFYQVGFRAASILDAMMRQPGFQPPAATRIGTKGLTPRESSDYLGIQDELISRAVRFIRKNAATRPLRVEDVLRQVPMSRSSFGARFRKAVGASAKEEIIRVRIQHVQRLLRKTDWSITRIAEAAGFDSSRDLDRLFGKKTGMTPSAFRSSAESGGEGVVRTAGRRPASANR
ncbi:MAG TPA: substrate-binding domain-containing protein [Candidatus Paceibacterota bacterium]|nr:substrate-binding domain-containing protein [Verrucomicrobiota bacterium]HRZ45047.1 substrate-binding domain-containing protein [Candidatus Paceibacterota bacterium]HRZ93995.1 substrate-binding domain-containing protein [Candidatus Paceibacterota bacterium]